MNSQKHIHLVRDVIIIKMESNVSNFKEFVLNLIVKIL